MNEKYMKCEVCGKESKDVCYRPEPYAQEIGNNPNAYFTACDDCTRDSAMDI